MHVDLKFTGDGILGAAAILLGAGIGVWAVFWQIRSSGRQLRSQLKADSENLQKQLEAQQANLKAQLDAEKQARNEEHNRQTIAVATAILFEIDYIYQYFVHDVENSLKLQGTSLNVELTRNKTVRLPFTVYEANAGVLGTLDQSLVKDIVRLYGGFTNYLMTLNELALVAETYLKSHPADPYHGVLVQRVKATMPLLKQPIAEVSERLCKFTGVPRERIAALTSNTSTNAQTN